MKNAYKPRYDYDDSEAKIRVSAPSDLQAGYTFEAHYTVGPDVVTFEATVVSQQYIYCSWSFLTLWRCH